jgi:hypothetical protein
MDPTIPTAAVDPLFYLPPNDPTFNAILIVIGMLLGIPSLAFVIFLVYKRYWPAHDDRLIELGIIPLTVWDFSLPRPPSPAHIPTDL